jgi:integron integrase
MRKEAPMSEPRLLDRVRDAIRTRHYSYRTEQAYVYWVKDFVRFHGLRHPMHMGEVEIAHFLSHLATRRRVAASTQNQALSALLFLYKAVLQRDIAFVGDVVRAKTPRRVPVVLTREEVARVLLNLDPSYRLMAQFLYGAGLRLHECLRLRVQDLDTGYGQIIVRDGKGGKDRVTMLPRTLAAPLDAQLAQVRMLHRRDIANGFPGVSLPYALARKYPNAPREPGWQYVFPATRLMREPRSGRLLRHHVYPDLPATGDQAGGARRRDRLAGDDPHVPALLRDASARVRVRHPYGSGVARAYRRQDDDDLHARAKPRRPRRAQSARCRGGAPGICGLSVARSAIPVPPRAGASAQTGW